MQRKKTPQKRDLEQAEQMENRDNRFNVKCINDYITYKWPSKSVKQFHGFAKLFDNF